MTLLRKLLFPFALIYGIISWIRNVLFDYGILKSHSFDFPVIAVGNLSVGGTGKTPQIEYIIRLLSDKYKVATLSRGYKRTSKGYVLANSNTTAETIGDEPFQFYSKFKNIQVAVDSNRKNGIENLLSQTNKPEIILLDDAFQHRKVEAGFYILLTTYNDLYTNDFILPIGNLREHRSGAKRADIVIVTKCPKNLSITEQKNIEKKLMLASHQDLYFSYIDYDDYIYSDKRKLKVTEIKDKEKLLIAGIAKPTPFFEYLKLPNDTNMTFPDHHNFTENDVAEIKKKSKEKFIITTEKDYVRLKNKLDNETLFYLPIKSKFISGEDNFEHSIFKFIKQNLNSKNN